jgi:DNA-binding MarR family transcriptional regulator
MARTGRFTAARVLDDARIGHEARATADDHLDLKIWLRLLACSVQIERQIRQRLRVRFDISLPRFAYLAQLHRHPGGLRMKALSRYLMVTGGSITGLTDELVKEGLVARVDDPGDRRSYLITLTPKGRSEFAVMAAEHERWLAALFKGLGVSHKEALYEQLGRLRVYLADRETELDTRSAVPSSPRRSAL